MIRAARSYPVYVINKQHRSLIFYMVAKKCSALYANFNVNDVPAESGVSYNEFLPAG
ncbi:hypothetical protein GCM10009414_01440 [Tatumella terrea]